MRYLILTGRFGMGHISVATAVKQELEKEFPQAKVDIADFTEEVFPHSHSAIYKAFGMVAGKLPTLYNALYDAADRFCDVNFPTKGKLSDKIQGMLDKYEPDIIISTLPLSSKLLSEYKGRTGSSIPLFTCITDVCVHGYWLCENTDMYFVASPSIKEQLIEIGIGEEKIWVTGIPVREAFMDNELQEVRKTTGNEKRKVLVMGGGLGILPDKPELLEYLDSETSIEATIITGKNKKAYHKLKEQYKNINVISYTNQVNTYMKDSDLIITKPGGITLFEAIHARVPLFVIDPYLGQEIGNASYIKEQQIGIVTYSDEEDYQKKLMNCLIYEESLVAMRNNMDAICAELSKQTISKIIGEMKN